MFHAPSYGERASALAARSRVAQPNSIASKCLSIMKSPSVGWVERSEAHRVCGNKRRVSLCSTHPAAGGRVAASQLDPSPFIRGPIARVVHPDRLLRQREIGQRLPAGGGTFHEVLDLLQI